MLAVPLQASASHNSFGDRTELTRGDEVFPPGDPNAGALAPDVRDGSHVDDKANVYHVGFMENNDLPIRDGPSDHAGAGYDPAKCTTFEEFRQEADSDPDATPMDLYKNALPGNSVDAVEEDRNDACWVGYLDNQKEYMLAGAFQFRFNAQGQTPGSTHDPLYFLNPDPEDGECDRGDWIVGQADPNTDPGPCEDASHKAWWPASWHRAVDTDLIEAAAFGGDDGANCQEATCGNVDLASNFEEDGRDFHGSGTLTVPLAATSTTFVFGYPHPDNPEAVNYDYGPDDPTFSQPLWGVPDTACGSQENQRVPVEECQLLGPEDLKLYDTKFAQHLPDDEKGRLCTFTPDTGIANPSGDAGGPCGLTGYEETTFIEDANAGGFGTGTVNTYQSTLPGWKNGLLDPTPAGTDSALWTVEPFGTDNTTGATVFADHSDYNDRRGGATSVYFDRNIIAINPEVPTTDDDMYCVRPNILTDGADVPTGPHEGEHAPGLYGDYQAAAIDVDMYIGGQNSVLMGGLHDGDSVPGYEGWHETFGEELETADQAAGDAFSTANDVLSQASEAADEAIPEETPADEVLAQVFDVADNALGTASTASDRIGPGEGDDPEPSNQLGPDNWDYHTIDIPEGLSCEAGSLEFVGASAEKGVGLRMDNTVTETPLNLKDPTILDEAGLPAREDTTSDGHWQTASYSFSTPLFSYVDETRDGSFSGCAPADATQSPDDDKCPWTGTWDAYNPGCSGSEGTKCDALLQEDGYVLYEKDVTQDESEPDTRPYGVGAVATLEVSGTTLLWTTDRSSLQASISDWTIVNQDPSQSTCVVMASEGFQDKLPSHLDGAATFEDAKQQLCPDHEEAQIMIWDDAFNDQVTLEDGGLSSGVNWAKITPTPDATRETMDMQDDRLCLSFVFSTASDRLAENTAAGEEPGADGTKGTIQLGADSTETYYTDCDVLTSHEAEDGEPTDDHPLDGKSFAFPDYSERVTS